MWRIYKREAKKIAASVAYAKETPISGDQAARNTVEPSMPGAFRAAPHRTGGTLNAARCQRHTDRAGGRADLRSPCFERTLLYALLQAHYPDFMARSKRGYPLFIARLTARTWTPTFGRGSTRPDVDAHLWSRKRRGTGQAQQDAMSRSRSQLRSPVFDAQSADALELTRVVGDQLCIKCKRVAGNPKIAGSDGRAGFFHLPRNPGVVLADRRTVGEAHGYQAGQAVQPLQHLGPTRAAR